MTEPTSAPRFRCPNYTNCGCTRPHFHFKVRDGERLMFTDVGPGSAGTPTGGQSGSRDAVS